LEPGNFSDDNKKNILYEFGREVKKLKEKVNAVFLAASFCRHEKDCEEELFENECFVIACLSKQGEKLVRVIPIDKDPEGNILLLNTKNQFSKDFDFDLIKQFYLGYDSGNCFSKIFGDN
jgi:hypothetical protein